MSRKGIDGSRFQVILDEAGNITHPMDWDKTQAQGINYVCWRMTVGSYYSDKSFPLAYAACVKYGWPLLPYHVTTDDPWKDQYKKIEEVLTKVASQPSPIVSIIQDLEVKRGTAELITSNVQHLDQCVIDELGRSSWIYSNAYVDEYLLAWSGWAHIPFIAASWLNVNQGQRSTSVTGSKPVLPKLKGFQYPVAWQWSADKPIPNNMGKVYGAQSQSIDQQM